MATTREKTILSEFIELYRENTCLWKVKAKEYMDKNKKDAAHKVLLGKLKELNPDATVEDVKKKINSLRSCFRKEFKKTINSMKSGAGTEEIYQPQLWYYNLLIFLKDHEIPKSSVSTSNPDFLEDVSQDGSQEDESASNVEVNSVDSISNIQSPELPPTPSTSSSSKRIAHKKIKTTTDTLLELVSQKLDSVKEDQHDIFAKNVGEKLRHLDPTMRIFAEKLINETLFEAQMGTLNRRAYICVPPLDNYSNRVSSDGSYIRQPTYHQSVQIQAASLSSCNAPSYPTMQSSSDLNSEETGNSVAQYFTSYQ